MWQQCKFKIKICWNNFEIIQILWKRVSINYDILFTNGNGVFRHHFSADEFGIFETSIAMFFAYLILLIATCFYAKLLFNKSLLHTTFKIYIVSIIFELLYFLFSMAEYSQFSSSGSWTPGMLTTGTIIYKIIDFPSFFLNIITLNKSPTIWCYWSNNIFVDVNFDR